MGTLGAGLTWGGSIFINPVVARVKDVRWVTVAGSVMMSVGLVAAGEARSVGCPLKCRNCRKTF